MTSILIVEDEKNTNEAIGEYLKSLGYNVLSAYDGTGALQIFKQNEIDLIVLDIMLPRISGISVLHEIRQSKNTPVRMLTAIDDEYTQVMSFDEMADQAILYDSAWKTYCRIAA